MKADETQRHQTEAGTEIECSQSRAEEISVCVCVCEREREREREREWRGVVGGGSGRRTARYRGLSAKLISRHTWALGWERAASAPHI
jgi:hypothetical protein